jgi:hypothetical protein
MAVELEDRDPGPERTPPEDGLRVLSEMRCTSASTPCIAESTRRAFLRTGSASSGSSSSLRLMPGSEDAEEPMTGVAALSKKPGGR